jgi:uncharacterized protein
VDRTNADSVPKLFDQLDEAGLRGRVSVYMAPVAPYTEVCADVKPNCMAGKSWAGLQTQLQLLAWERGYGAPSLPQARHNVCVADRASDVVIVPSGLVFKCWNDVTSPDQAVFDLASMSNNETMKSNLSRWQRWGPFNFRECGSCSVLPLCMGGCPHVSMARGRGACKELKHNLREAVLLAYLNQRQGTAAEQLTQRLQRWVAQVVKHSSAENGKVLRRPGSDLV